MEGAVAGLEVFLEAEYSPREGEASSSTLEGGSNKGRRLFCCDWWEAYVISDSYEMGDPLASRFGEVGRTVEGGV